MMIDSQLGKEDKESTNFVSENHKPIKLPISEVGCEDAKNKASSYLF